MYQMLEMDRPIPSCDIHAMKYVKGQGEGDREGKWKYVYAVKTPVEITDSNMVDLIVYEYISDLRVELGKGQHPEAVNIHFTTMSQYMELIEAQVKADEVFRANWLEKHPDSKVSDFARRELEHRDYDFEELRQLAVHNVSALLETGQDKDVFAAV